MIEVTSKDIKYSEQLLLEKGQSFDNERQDFIQNLSTLDLQAVPGSGKTTALLAKLLILERKMPFEGDSGVLVISHTNAAVDEIIERIGKHAPKLFHYPNFVGTIQSFVNTFLALPLYTNQFKQKPFRIDNEVYFDCVSDLFTKNLPGFSRQEQKNARYYLMSNRIQYSYRLIYQDNTFIPVDSISGKELNINRPRRSKNYVDFTVEEKERIKEWLVLFKFRIFQKGALHFDDAYTLAQKQLSEIPGFELLLQKRFKYVFVDEMQDMDSHQLDILEKIFYANMNSDSTFQRIGDKNQAIFGGGSIHINEIWNQRDLTLEINGSHRINELLAPIIKRLSIESCEIEGRNKNSDGTDIKIKPHLLIFDDETLINVVPKYAEVIQKFQERDEIPKPSPNKFMAIAWRKENDEEGKLGLSDYWNAYSHSTIKSQIDFKVLKDYLIYYDKSDQSLESVRTQILNALLKVLRLENIYDEFGRFYTKRKLLSHCKINHTAEYEKLKLIIYECSLQCINDKANEAYISLQKYMSDFLAVFNSKSLKSAYFINNESELEIEQITEVEESNHYKDGDIEVEIGTVHSAKGQTHTATLYLESYFQLDGRGANAKSYESQRLSSQILGQEVDNATLGKRVKQSLKMAYVGFSRPTHLLCFAVHKERFENYLSDIDEDIWEVINVD